MGVGAYGISVAAFGRDARRKVLIASMRPRLLLPGKVQINQHTAEPVVPIVFLRGSCAVHPFLMPFFCCMRDGATQQKLCKQWLAFEGGAVGRGVALGAGQHVYLLHADDVW